MNRIEINRKWCKGCGICAAFCPKKVLGLDEETEKATVVNQDECIACYMCELRCPDLAIKVITEGDKGARQFCCRAMKPALWAQ